MPPNQGSSNKFLELIQEKTKLKEDVGFKMFNEPSNRWVTININRDRILFDLGIYRGENEEELFLWFHNELISPLKSHQEKFLKIQWRTNYDNEIIRTFN